MPDRVISIRVSPEDYGWIDDQRAHRSVSDYVRGLIRKDRKGGVVTVTPTVTSRSTSVIPQVTFSR